MQIFINGAAHSVDGDRISHEEVCRRAGRPYYASVVYTGKRNGDFCREGMTYPGKAVELEDGMHFECVVTGNA